MKILVEEAQKLIDKYGFDEVPIIYLSDIYINAPTGVVQISQGMKYDGGQYDLLFNNNIKEIDVIYSERLITKLAMNFPASYRIPRGKLSIIDLDRLIDTIESSNGMTRRKRTVIALNEVYKQNASGLYECVLKYGDKLNHKRWNDVKSSLGRTAQIEYRIDEAGIVVFVILNPGDPQYAQKYMRFTELVSMIVEHGKTEVNIATDFNPESDVYTVTDPAELLQIYSDKKVVLVIVADDLTDDYKPALAKIKAFDKYARMMVIKNPDAAHRKEILTMIKNVYGKNLWED